MIFFGPVLFYYVLDKINIRKVVKDGINSIVAQRSTNREVTNTEVKYLMDLMG